MTFVPAWHLFVNVMTCAIPMRRLRRRLRRRLLHFRIRDFVEYRRFVRGDMRPNAVLLVETNDTHGEVLAGLLDYFRELGFAVDVLVNSEVLKERPFCRTDLRGVNMFSCYFGAFSWFFGTARFSRYAHVVLMSSAGYRYIDGSDAASVVVRYGLQQKARSLLVVEHELRDVERFGEQGLLAAGRLLTLGQLERGVPVVPVSFGAATVPRRGASSSFIVVGGIQRDRKNHAALVEAVRSLLREGLHPSVVVIGSGNLGTLPDDVRFCFEVTGRLDYPEMLARVESAVFFLPLLDHANPAHERYVTTGVTGSAQLIYAFAKVPVIESRFAPFYGFSDENAIVTDDLAAGMAAAMRMSDADYCRRQAALQSLAQDLRAQSLENLRQALGRGTRDDGFVLANGTDNRNWAAIK